MKNLKLFGLDLVTVAIVVSLMTWGSQSLHFSGFTDSGLNVAKGLVNGLLHPNVSLIFDMSDSGIPILTLTDDCDCSTWYNHWCDSCDSCKFPSFHKYCAEACRYVLPRTHPVDSHNPCTYLGYLYGFVLLDLDHSVVL